MHVSKTRKKIEESNPSRKLQSVMKSLDWTPDTPTLLVALGYSRRGTQ